MTFNGPQQSALSPFDITHDFLLVLHNNCVPTLSWFYETVIFIQYDNFYHPTRVFCTPIQSDSDGILL